jgi:hypothetical protein
MLWSEAMRTCDVYGRMKDQYGDNCMSQKKIYEWVKVLKKVVP